MPAGTCNIAGAGLAITLPMRTILSCRMGVQEPLRNWYIAVMTKLLEQAIEKLQALPDEMQDEAARMLHAYAGSDEPVVELTPDEEADLIEAQAEIARGEIATPAEVEAVLAKYRP